MLHYEDVRDLFGPRCLLSHDLNCPVSKKSSGWLGWWIEPGSDSSVKKNKQTNKQKTKQIISTFKFRSLNRKKDNYYDFNTFWDFWRRGQLWCYSYRTTAFHQAHDFYSLPLASVSQLKQLLLFRKLFFSFSASALYWNLAIFAQPLILMHWKSLLHNCSLSYQTHYCGCFLLPLFFFLRKYLLLYNSMVILCLSLCKFLL